MTIGRSVRVRLSGDREGAYVVAEERADGSLVLKPDGERHARVSVDSPGTLGQLLRRRPDVVPTTTEALDAWGVDLLGDERVVEFAIADVAGERGFVALTNRRLIFLVRGRTSLEPRQQHALSELTSVEPLRGHRKRGFVVSCEGSAPILVESRDRGQLERLRAKVAGSLKS
jgi:hypothetical protein